MATHITQIEDPDSGVTILRIEGDLMLEDAALIDRLVNDIAGRGSGVISLDLADLDLMDSESAAVLKRIESEGRAEIIGMEIFLQNLVNKAENR